MKNWKIWTAFLSVFAAGIFTGVLGTGLYMQNHFAKPKTMKEFHERLRNRFMDRMIKEVRPDEDKIPAIKEIVSRTTREVESVRQKAHPQVKGIFKSSEAQIKKLLTQEQAKRFDKMLEHMKKRRFSLFRLPPPPPPHFEEE